ncbi:MAG: metalloregulator ArsR/SmtB family transcription factor [Kofleriaceae bacterium]
MQSDVFRALADPTRRAVFEQLTRGEATVTELTRKFDVSQPAISQHLAALKAGGLVAVRRAGRFTYYRIKPAGLRPLVDWIEHYQAFWLGRMKKLKALLEEMEDD